MYEGEYSFIRNCCGTSTQGKHNFYLLNNIYAGGGKNNGTMFGIILYLEYDSSSESSIAGLQDAC